MFKFIKLVVLLLLLNACVKENKAQPSNATNSHLDRSKKAKEEADRLAKEKAEQEQKAKVEADRIYRSEEHTSELQSH